MITEKEKTILKQNLPKNWAAIIAKEFPTCSEDLARKILNGTRGNIDVESSIITLALKTKKEKRAKERVKQQQIKQLQS